MLPLRQNRSNTRFFFLNFDDPDHNGSSNAFENLYFSLVCHLNLKKKKDLDISDKYFRKKSLSTKKEIKYIYLRLSKNNK